MTNYHNWLIYDPNDFSVVGWWIEAIKDEYVEYLAHSMRLSETTQFKSEPLTQKEIDNIASQPRASHRVVSPNSSPWHWDERPCAVCDVMFPALESHYLCEACRD